MTIRIMSLDDEPQMGELLNLILERQGYESMFSSDNCEAWAMLHIESFDLLTQDLMRPNVHGWKFKEALESDEALRDLPVIIISAKSQAVDPYPLKELEIDGYVTKPFGPQELLVAIGGVLAKYDKSPPTKDEWKALCRMSDRPLETLGAALRDPNRDVRRRATRALTLKNERGAVELIISALKDEDCDVQKTATWGLELTGGLQAIEPLVETLSDRAWKARGATARALGRLRDDRAVEPLIEMLRDVAHPVRLSATVALGMIGDKRALEAISLTTSDKDGWVRRAAAGASKRISESNQESRMGRLLSLNRWHRKEAARFLPGANNEWVFNRLVDALQDENGDVRHAAVSSLGHLKDRYTVEPLIAALRDESARVRKEAIRALGAIGDKRAAGPVANMLLDKDVPVRRDAALVLGKFRDRCAVEPLTAALQDSDREVRDRAGSSLKLLDDVWSAGGEGA